MSEREKVRDDVPSQFRLGPDVRNKLDELVDLFAAESGGMETRSNVIRQLIHREHARRMRGKKS